MTSCDLCNNTTEDYIKCPSCENNACDDCIEWIEDDIGASMCINCVYIICQCCEFRREHKDEARTCRTFDCCEVMCSRCSYYIDDDWYCEKCRDKFIDDETETDSE